MKHVWIHPTGNRNRVVMLTDEALLLALPEPLDLQRFQESIQQGEPKAALLPQDVQVIPLISILKLRSDRDRPRIKIVHGFGGRPSESVAQFEEFGLRDNAFEVIRQALGPGFSVSLRETGKLKSGWRPLAKALMVCVLAIFMRNSAVQAAVETQDPPPQEGLLIFGPTAVTLIASLLVLFYLREFYRCTQSPVAHLELVRDDPT